MVVHCLETVLLLLRLCLANSFVVLYRFVAELVFIQAFDLDVGNGNATN